MNKYTYKISRVPAEPRSKRLADTGREGASSAAGNVIVSGRGDSAPQYWERVITATDGAELPEEQYYLKPQGASNVSVPGDVTAYSDNPGKEPSRLPVSTDHETTGLFRAKRNGGLIYDVSTGSWMVDSQMMGGLSNLAITHKGDGNGVSWLQWDSEKKELIAHKANYANVDHVHLEYATSSWVSSSFAAANHTHSQYATKTYVDDTFSVIGHTHSQYVTLDSAQTINGKKTFKPGLITGDVTNVYIEFSGGNSLSGKDKNATISNLYFNYNSSSKNTKIDKDNNLSTAGDVAAYSTGGALANFVPVADAYTYGLVKIDGNTIKKDANGRLYCTVQGGSGGGTTTASYWRPSVKASGVLSWSLDSSTSAPSSVNIKGPKGDTGSPGAKGQGVTYQWSGTSLCLGTIDSSGYISWGSYVNLKGEKGDPGSGSWNGGTIYNPIKIKSGPPTLWWGDNWYAQTGTDFNFYNTRWSTACVYISGVNHGNMVIRGKLTQESDMKLKRVESHLKEVLDKVVTLDTFRFRYTDEREDKINIGMSAQQVKEYFPELVFTESNGYYSMDYVSMSTIAIAAIKELNAKVNELQQIIEQLKGGTNGTTN